MSEEAPLLEPHLEALDRAADDAESNAEAFVPVLIDELRRLLAEVRRMRSGVSTLHGMVDLTNPRDPVGSVPPSDEGGGLSYHEYRERQGQPIGADEEDARAELRWVREHAGTDRRRVWAAERRLREFTRAAGDAVEERQRAEVGVPLTSAEIEARALYRAIEDSVIPPWKPDELLASNEAARRLREATAKAFADAGVEQPEWA